MSTITRMLSAAFGLSTLAAPFAANAEIALPGDRVFPESLTSKADGTLLIGSLGAGGVFRVKPGTQTAELWIKPGAYVDGDKAAIETIKDGFHLQPTSGATAWVTEGQLTSAFDPSKGPPHLPFQVHPVALSVP